MKQRKPNRLRKFDYSSDGYYFVTICTKNKNEYFGKVINQKIVLNNLGKIADDCWKNIPKRFEGVNIDEFVIMPNHVHGIIVIKNQSVGAIFKSPDDSIFKSSYNAGEINFAPTKTNLSLSNIIKWFKSISSILIRKQIPNFQWQKSFYDHIIRNENALNEIRTYIRYNPLNWNTDDENPNRDGK